MDPNKNTIFVGPPGTGKTRRLIDVLEQEMEDGVNSKRIGYMAFTKKAAEIAKDRAMTRFGLKDEDLPYFRTIHSLAFRQLGMKRDMVMQWNHYRELGEKLGMSMRSTKKVEDGSTYGMSKEERLMFIEGLSRIKMEDLKKTWAEADEDEVDWWELERFGRALREYKRSRMVMDYTDMLTDFVAQKTLAPNLDVLIIDEAQDLSPIQWAAVDMISKKVKRVYFAGDDDQAIYKWAGADVNAFIGLQGSVTTLDQSHRVPAAVHPIAESIAKQISHRRDKTYKPRDMKGAVKYYSDPEEVDMRKETGSWLLLARNGYMLAGLEEMCIRNGYSFESVSKSPLHSDSLKAIRAWESLRKGNAIPVDDAMKVVKFITPGHGIKTTTRESLRKLDNDSFVTMEELKSNHGLYAEPNIWHEVLDRIPLVEKEYFIAARKRGETLVRQPRITISTIHAAKGGEADNVLLLTDMSYRTFQEMHKNFDDECRVFYVAVTRAAQALHIIQPRSNLCFDL